MVLQSERPICSRCVRHNYVQRANCGAPYSANPFHLIAKPSRCNLVVCAFAYNIFGIADLLRGIAADRKKELRSHGVFLHAACELWRARSAHDPTKRQLTMFPCDKGPKTRWQQLLSSKPSMGMQPLTVLSSFQAQLQPSNSCRATTFCRH